MTSVAVGDAAVAAEEPSCVELLSPPQATSRRKRKGVRRARRFI
jgi:hypothetical protein